MQALDITGQVFGRLTVIHKAWSDEHGITWSCKCACGNQYAVYGHSLRSGKTKSCGCWHREHSGQINKSHGRSSTPEYSVWEAMRARCTNPSNKHYKNYGGRGVGVCVSWIKFSNFFADMGQRPSSLHSLERVDNDLGYSPENCRWATRKEQQNNMRTNRRLTYKGTTRTVAQWAA